jgi:hypothetical protein
MKSQATPIHVTLVALLIVGFTALLPKSQAVVPAPDGGYPGGNTAEGQNALFRLDTGGFNTAVGWLSLRSLSAGSFNTAVGAGTLFANTADEITACGAAALLSNTTGEGNTAHGAFSLFSNTEGNFNTAVGDRALFGNTTGSGNTANGIHALFNNTEGSDNTASGHFALGANTMGSNNTANGASALSSNTAGVQNTASGTFALSQSTGDNNTTVGSGALQSSTTGSGNIAMGASAGSDVTTASNVIAIGASGDDLGNSCFIGQIYTNVQPQVGTDPDLVTMNSRGRLGRANVSSRRYKHDIQPMDKASETIYALKPVSFRYHKQYDATQTIVFGLIAEEVAEVHPDLVGRNHQGQPESVPYEQINAMLLNEFLKQHKLVEEQQATIAQLKREMQTVVVRLKEHDSEIQEVSDQVQMNGSTARVVSNQ